MVSDSVKLARINNRAAIRADLMKLATNPVMVGFSALLLNHAIYKAGWYSPGDVRLRSSGIPGLFGFTQSAEESAATMHDTVAGFIMTAGVAYAIAPALPAVGTGITGLIGGLK